MPDHYSFSNLEDLVTHLREQDKKVQLLFAFNATGKTRLSRSFGNAGKKYNDEGSVIERDTLYFNSFTEDLFYWDNDLDNDTKRVLKLNKNSKFFEGLSELEMENRIRPLFRNYTELDFYIDYEKWHVMFTKEEKGDEEPTKYEFIKVSRGEERIFVWCFFLVIMQLAIDKQEAYSWVKYIYIDDPISSLDDHNAISVAHHLANMIKSADNEIKTVITTHHALFFNVLCNEFGSAKKYFVKKLQEGYSIKSTTDSPFIYHIHLINILSKAVAEDKLYTYHFSLLRTVLEKAANFHGYTKFSDCIEIEGDDEEKTLHTRLINILNHGAYSLFEPVEMVDENKKHFKTIFSNYLSNYKFNELLFTEE